MSGSPLAASGPPTAPPGWYQDHQTRQWWWWDGWSWISAAPEPAEPASRWFPDTPTLRLPAAVLGIALITFLTVATRVADLLPETPAAFVQLALFVVSIAGMPLAAWYGSRRWGTGRIVDDLGIRFGWHDLPLGIAGAILLTIALTLVNVIFYAIGVPNGSNLTEVSEGGRDVVTFVVLFVTAGLLAPVTEELLFRGLIQRGLQSRWSAWIAVAIQAAVFGAAHVTPTEGWGNVNLIVSLAVMGFGVGAVARLTGRLGTAMVTHALFNCLQLTLLWFSMG